MEFTEQEIRELLLRHLPFDKWLPVNELVIGAYYICKARNFSLGKWNGKAFEYTRCKFGMHFEDTEYHWDNGPPYGTVKPLQII